MIRNIFLIFILILATSLVFSDDSLHKAAHKGNISRVKEILKEGINPDERDSFGGTALHAAMFQDNLEVIRILIEAGLDVDAQGTSNGYTPLHDAVWVGNYEGAEILLKHGARTDIKGSNGFTAYEKAVDENKNRIADLIKNVKVYSPEARKYYSKNDVIAFVYKWFAGFDHQKEPDYFTKHLNKSKVDMTFPDFPISSIEDFLRWYQNVIDTIKWNSHDLSDIKVTGSEKEGFSVSLNIRWKAETYDNQKYDVNVHQDWKVDVDNNRNFIITKHRAKL